MLAHHEAADMILALSGTTNGRLATPDRVEACMRAGLDSLKFSFNFSDPQQFHDVTRVRASDFWTVEQNLREARRAG